MHELFPNFKMKTPRFLSSRFWKYIHSRVRLNVKGGMRTLFPTRQIVPDLPQQQQQEQRTCAQSPLNTSYPPLPPRNPTRLLRIEEGVFPSEDDTLSIAASWTKKQHHNSPDPEHKPIINSGYAVSEQIANRNSRPPSPLIIQNEELGQGKELLFRIWDAFIIQRVSNKRYTSFPSSHSSRSISPTFPCSISVSERKSERGRYIDLYDSPSHELNTYAAQIFNVDTEGGVFRNPFLDALPLGEDHEGRNVGKYGGFPTESREEEEADWVTIEMDVLSDGDWEVVSTGFDVSADKARSFPTKDDARSENRKDTGDGMQEGDRDSELEELFQTVRSFWATPGGQAVSETESEGLYEASLVHSPSLVPKRLFSNEVDAGNPGLGGEGGAADRKQEIDPLATWSDSDGESAYDELLRGIEEILQSSSIPENQDEINDDDESVSAFIARLEGGVQEVEESNPLILQTPLTESALQQLQLHIKSNSSTSNPSSNPLTQVDCPTGLNYPPTREQVDIPPSSSTEDTLDRLIRDLESQNIPDELLDAMIETVELAILDQRRRNRVSDWLDDADPSEHDEPLELVQGSSTGGGSSAEGRGDGLTRESRRDAAEDHVSRDHLADSGAWYDGVDGDGWTFGGFFS